MSTLVAQYILVTAETPIELEAKVNTRMQSGWKPQGGVAACVGYTEPRVSGDHVTTRCYLYQALILPPDAP